MFTNRKHIIYSMIASRTPIIIGKWIMMMSPIRYHLERLAETSSQLDIPFAKGMVSGNAA